MATQKVGTVSYLNAQPLSGDLEAVGLEVSRAVPSRIAEQLATGEVALALVPVAAVLADGGYRVVPGYCIGCDGEVESVLLVAETEPEAWTEVVLDGASRTSQRLARLILEDGPLSQRVRAGLPIREGAVGEGLRAASGTVAALVIGDEARTLPERLSVRLDLGALWKQWTGLPFVFAVWAGRPEVPYALQAKVRESGTLGLAAREQRFTDEADRRYVMERLRYSLDDLALVGLRRFAALGAKRGWFATGDVVLYGPESETLERPGALDEALLAASQGAGLTDAEAIALGEQGRGPDLAAAAALCARVARDEDELPWQLGATVDLSAGLDASLAALKLAAEAGCTRAVLRNLPRATSLAVLSGAIAALVQAGLPLLGLDAELGVDGVLAVKAAGLTALALPAKGPLLSESAPELPVLKAARAAGLLDVVPMTVGRGESWAQRIAHLRVVAALAAIGEAPLTLVVRQAGWRGPESEGEGTAAELMRSVAVARLVLGPALFVAVDPDQEGYATTQALLYGGADRLTPLAFGEGWAERAAERDRQLRDAGFEPVRQGMATPAAKGAGGVQRRRSFQPLRSDLRA